MVTVWDEICNTETTVTVAEIKVYDAFTLSAGTNATYCLNDSPVADLEASPAGGAGGYTYQWQVLDGSVWGNVPSNGTSATYAPSVSTAGEFHYQVVVTDGQCGTLTSNEVVITVNPLPTISAAPASQEITYGDDITPVVITNTTSSVTLSTLPAGLSYNISTQTISSTPGTHIAAGNYTITATATSGYGCGTAVQEIQINVKKKNLTISLDSSKVYDGTPLVVTCAQVHYSGLVEGDVFTTGTITTDGFVAGDYYCTDNQFNRMWADYTATQSGFGPASVTHNYAPTFNVVLRISSLPLTLTANSATKVYDGTPLTDNGFIVNSTLGTGDAVSATVNGSQTCLGEADNVIDAATVQVMHDNGDGTTTDVTSSYNPVTLNDGLLKVTPITTGFECPEAVTLTLIEGTYEMTVTDADLAGTATLTPANAHTHVGHNLAALNPMDEGDHTVVWTLYDDCGNAMTSCEQVVTVVYAPCEPVLGYDGHDYDAVRIGYQCWMTENLRNTVDANGNAIADYHAYKDNADNMGKFGYLYSWYSAVGVPEGNDAVSPVTQTGANGQPYVQGICPENWGVASAADISILNYAAGDVMYLKDTDSQYWTAGNAGQEPNTGFRERGNGMYNSTLGRYEGILSNAYSWTSDAVVNTPYASTAEINYYCSSILIKMYPKTDRQGVRCVKKN